MGYVVAFAVFLPISVAILIVSMILSSNFVGGIEFGSVQSVIAKSAVLLVVVNIVGLLPFGILLSLPIWWGGLMVLFHIDFWECRVLVFVNWFLNVAGQAFLFGLLVHS